MKRILLFFSILTAIFSCKREDFTDIPFDSKMVVEGWIETGDVARVILMQNIPMTVTVDSTDFLQYVLRSATVIVSCDGIDDTLQLRSASGYLPPYMYVGQKLIGQANKLYKLKVIHLNTVLTAESTIPEAIDIQKIIYHKEFPTDTLGRLSIRFSDPVGQKNYYQVATLVEDYDDVFIPALYGNFSDTDFTDATIDFNITRGITIFPKTNLELYYYNNDRVHIRLRTMNKEGYDFWNSWQNEVLNSQNPIFPANTSLKSNIKGNGIGIWCGYGQSTHSIQL